MKRTVIASLWFLTAFCVHELAWSIAGSPRLLGIAFGAAAAAFVLIDPFRMLSGADSTSTRSGATDGASNPVASLHLS